jgi:hypothetical protein
MTLVSLKTPTKDIAMTARHTTLLVTLATVTACAPVLRVTGEVNGDELPQMLSAAYIPFEDEDNDEVVVSVMLTSMPDACAFATDFVAAFSDLNTAATRNDVERALDDYQDALSNNEAIGEWAVLLDAHADREDDLRDDANIDIDDTGERSGASLLFFDDEPEFDIENGVNEFNVDQYRAESGDVIWDLDDKRRSIDFDATLKLREMSEDGSLGDRAGTITVSGRAARCQSWEDIATED